MGVGDGTNALGRIWLRCSCQPMVSGSLEVLTNRILVPTASKNWGAGQMKEGLVCLDIGVSVRGGRASTQSSPSSEGTSSSTYSPGQTTVSGEEARRI